MSAPTRERALEILREVAGETAYRPGYEGPFVEIWGDDFESWPPQVVCKTVDFDAYHPDRGVQPFPWEGEDVPNRVFDARSERECRRECVEFIFECLCRAAVHDVCEWFLFRGERVFDPHGSADDRGLTTRVKRLPWVHRPDDVAKAKS